MIEGMRDWRGLEVDSGLKDEWLERMNSIPGVAIRHTCEGHVGDDRLGARYPNIRFQTEWEGDDQSLIAQAFHEFSNVSVDGNFFEVSSRTERADMSEEDLDAWWDRVLSTLERFSAGHFASGSGSREKTIEDLEREIVAGGASVFSWKARTPTQKRGENVYYYLDFPPEVWDETTRFFRELERLNGARLYDVFMAMAARQGIMDLSNTRKWFGSAAAEYGIAHFTLVNKKYIEGIVIPDWVAFLDGPYAACVFWHSDRSDVAVVLVANQAAGLWMGMQMLREDRGILSITGQEPCKRGTLETALEKTPIPDQVDRRCQDSMTVESLLDFLTETISFSDKELLRRRLKEALAECFQAS